MAPEPTHRAESVAEERFDYPDGSTAFQRRCPNCDKGLLLAPARFCPACGGSGYLVRWTHSDGSPS